MSEHEPYQTDEELAPASENETNKEDSNAQDSAQSGEFAEQPAATRDDKGDEGKGTGARAGEYS